MSEKETRSLNESTEKRLQKILKKEEKPKQKKLPSNTYPSTTDLKLKLGLK